MILEEIPHRLADMQRELADTRQELDDLRSTIEAAPSVPPTPQISPISARTQDAALRIQRLIIHADFLASYISGGSPVRRNADGTLRAETVQRLIGLTLGGKASCDEVPEDGYRRSGDGSSLWPRAYSELDEAVVSACFVLTVIGVSPESAASVIAIDDGEIERLLAALPDYSPAQLRRALAERE